MDFTLAEDLVIAPVGAGLTDPVILVDVNGEGIEVTANAEVDLVRRLGFHRRRSHACGEHGGRIQQSAAHRRLHGVRTCTQGLHRL